MFKKIIALSLFPLYIFACSGDCVSCHPTLIKDGDYDTNHLILKTCKKCHIDGTKIILVENNQTKEIGFKIEKVKEGEVGNHSSCGNDCWKCHDIQNVQKINIKEHKNLNECIDCHTKLDSNYQKELFPNIDDTLSGFLKKENK